MVSITSKWDRGTMTRLVVNQELVSRYNDGQGRTTRLVFPKLSFSGSIAMKNTNNTQNMPFFGDLSTMSGGHCDVFSNIDGSLGLDNGQGCIPRALGI
jgi:hypothetical protein